MDDMNNKHDSEKLSNHYRLEEKNKPIKGISISENNQEDEESGGGHGKSQKGFFKQEKLIKLIDKGKFNAKHFWSFLNRNGADQHTLKESTLEKFAGEKEEKDFKAEEVKVAEEQVDKIKERQADSEIQNEIGMDEAETTEKSLKEELETKDSQRQLQKQQKEKTTQNQQQSDVQEMARQAITGNKLAGSIIGAYHGNPLGFVTTTNNAAHTEATQQDQLRNDTALHGKAAPFGALFANPHGLTVTAVQAGAIGSALTDNVKSQQEKQTQSEKNNLNKSSNRSSALFVKAQGSVTNQVKSSEQIQTEKNSHNMLPKHK